MTEEKVLEDIEDAPHIALNQDGTTINLGNWQQPANRQWSYRHCDQVLPYLRTIDKAGPANPLIEQPVDLSDITTRYRNQDMPLEMYLRESHCNGFIVLQGNRVIYENQRRMAVGERHLCQSVTKTTVCAVLGGLIAQGLIDPQKTVDEYIPGVASGFARVKLQNLLDMNSALKFSEDFTDPQSDILHYEMLQGWHPDTGGQTEGAFPYLCNIQRDDGMVLDDITHYLCPNTDMLACIAEQVTGKSFPELFQQAIYRHIGAEMDAQFCVDRQGRPIAGGGLILGLRDLARYGQVFANKGVAADGTQVIPAAWIEDCLDKTKGTHYYIGEGFSYHNQMTTDGRALCHLGVGGQMLYVDTETLVVVAQFSTSTSQSNGDLDVGNALYGIGKAISERLSAGQ